MRKNWILGWVCGLLTLFCIVLINPRVEMGLNDDWSYIYSARVLADTGHIVYNGWATAILGVQLFLGALFIKLFGFSFTTVRASSMLVAVLSAPLAHALLMRCGVRAWNATLGTLTFVLSPLYFPLATTFMSDSFAMFLMLLFFYACVRCVQAGTGRAAIWWLAGAVAAGLAAGTVRQIAWLTILISLPCVAWQQRKRRAMLPAGIAMWIISTATVFLAMHWFKNQPYISSEKLIAPFLHWAAIPRIAGFFWRGLASCSLLLSPVLFAIALRFPFRQKGKGKQFALVLVVVSIGVAAGTALFGSYWWGTWLLGDHVTTSGIIWHPEVLGPRPTIVPGPIQVSAAFFLLATVGISALTLWPYKSRLSSGTNLLLSDTALFWMTIPFTAGYLVLIFTRLITYDRYYLPLLFLATLALLRLYERWFASPVSWLCMLPLVLLAGYGVAGTHDAFAETRARLAAAEELHAAGVDRTQIHAGFEYDGWTQVELTGYVNEPRLRPVSAYQKNRLPPGLRDLRPSDRYPWRSGSGLEKDCYTWFALYTPSIHARYALASQPAYCFADSHFPAVQYRTWLPPRQNAIYISEIPKRFW
jgi:hypothetical protein